MKHTVESLTAEGWRGIQRNTLNGHTREARYVLDNLAWTFTNRPDRLRFVHDDIGGKVRVHMENENWIPPSRFERYAERPMTGDELEAAYQRLERKGFTVIR